MIKDMYGHDIHPLGDSGYGVSVSFSARGLPWFSLFHDSDGFHQCLFTFDFTSGRPSLNGAFLDRVAEVLALFPETVGQST